MARAGCAGALTQSRFATGGRVERRASACVTMAFYRVALMTASSYLPAPMPLSAKMP